MKKKFSTNDLIGMKIKNADKLASQHGYAVACFRTGEKQDMQDADRSYEWLVLVYNDAGIVVEVTEA